MSAVFFPIRFTVGSDTASTNHTKFIWFSNHIRRVKENWEGEEICVAFHDLSQTEIKFAFVRLSIACLGIKYLFIEIYVTELSEIAPCLPLCWHIFELFFFQYYHNSSGYLYFAKYITLLFVFYYTEITSSESDAENQFNSVERTSPSPIHNRHQRSHQHDFEDDDSFDGENGDDFVQNHPLDRGPYFDVAASQNVTTLVGSTVYLNCRVRNLGNKTVSENPLWSFSN